MKLSKNVNSELPNSEIVIVCFGTTAISGDALGPTVGDYLVRRYNLKAFVYGTAASPINGKNMAEWISFIAEVHKDALIVAVDASLGAKSKIGQIIVRSDGVCPAAVKGEKKRFGDIGVLGVVGESKGDALMQLMQVSPVYVTKLADKVANIIYSALSTDAREETAAAAEPTRI